MVDSFVAGIWVTPLSKICLMAAPLPIRIRFV
uniref:Uncharacterized protein n=1 Tax=Arundo donax TaxID=35708 RepID=A0A0A9CB43_ARUDO